MALPKPYDYDGAATTLFSEDLVEEQEAVARELLQPDDSPFQRANQEVVSLDQIEI